MEESDAIKLLKDGNLAGLAELVKQHQVEAVQAAFLIVGDRALAEDIAQDAFLKAAIKIHQFKDGHPFRPWFMRIVTNDAIKAVMKSSKSLSLETMIEMNESPAWLCDTGPGPEDIISRNEEKRRVWRALGELTPKERAVVVRRYYLDMRGSEISQRLERSISSVKWSLHAAKKRLRSILVSERISGCSGVENDSERGRTSSHE